MSDFNPLWFTPTNEEGIYNFRIDNSSVENFTTCARAAEYYSILKRELNSNKSALFYGTVIHAALEVRKEFQVAAQLAQATRLNWEDRQVALIEAAYSSNPVGLDEWRSADQAVKTIQAYNKRYPINGEPFTLIPGTVEIGFQQPLGVCELNCNLPSRSGSIFVRRLNVVWTGRIDGLVNYDGSIFVLDHKTSSIGGAQYFEDFRQSQQMLGYCWAAREMGHNAVGLLLDSIIGRKPTATGKGLELQRDRFWYTDEQIDEWKKDVFMHITDFLEHAARNYFPKATKWCHGKYGECQYWQVCTSPHDLRLPLLISEQYKDVNWSPLHDRDVTKQQTE